MFRREGISVGWKISGEWEIKGGGWLEREWGDRGIG